MALFVFHKNIVHEWILNKTFFISSSEIAFQRNNFHFFTLQATVHSPPVILIIVAISKFSEGSSNLNTYLWICWFLWTIFFTPNVLFNANSLRTVLFFVDLASVGYSYADTTVWPASFPVCAGQQQSPIDLLSNISSETTHEAFQFTHHTDSITENMTNTGHSCKTNSLKITYFATHSKSHSKYRM